MRRRSREPRTPSPTSTRSPPPAGADYFQQEDIYGIHFLSHVTSEIKSQKLSKMIVPVVVLSGTDKDGTAANTPSPGVRGSRVLGDSARMNKVP